MEKLKKGSQKLESLKEKRPTRFRIWKSGKRWLTSSAVALALFGVGLPMASYVLPGVITHVQAATIPPADGSNFGTLNGKTVAQSKTADMKSQSFQNLVNSFLKDASKTSSVVDNIAWQSNTTLENGKSLADLGTGAAWMGPNPSGPGDGWDDNDLAKVVPKIGGKAKIKNAGTATVNGQKVNLDLGITTLGTDLRSSIGADDTSSSSIILSVKNMNGVIGIDFLAPTGLSAGGEGGGESRASRSFVNPNQAYSYVQGVYYSVTYLDSATGQVLPGTTLSAIKVSDIDAKQKADVSSDNALGYIVGPNTNLHIDEPGFSTDSDKSLNTDSTNLTPNAYVKLMQGNTTTVHFQYNTNSWEAPYHNTIAQGLFGNPGFKLLTPPTPPELPAPKFTPVVDDENPNKQVMSTNRGTDNQWGSAKMGQGGWQGLDLNNKQTLTDEGWTWQINKAITGKDTTWSDWQEFLSQAKAYNEAWDKYDEEYQAYVDMGGSEPKAERVTLNTKAEDNVYTSMSITDVMSEKKLDIEAADKMLVVDDKGKALTDAQVKITKSEVDSEGKVTVTATFDPDFVKSDAFYTETYHLVIDSKPDIEDSTLSEDSQKMVNKAEVDTSRKPDQPTNEVNVKPKYTDPSLSKAVMQYDGDKKTPDELIDSKEWKEKEFLHDHDTLYAYKLNYVVGNHSDYSAITLSDPQFADLQIASADDLAVYASSTDSQGTTERKKLDKDQYEIVWKVNHDLQTDGEQKNTIFEIKLKDVSQYARKTTNFTVVLANVTLKGATGKEEVNYLQEDDLIHVYNVSHLHTQDKTPGDGDKGEYDKDSNKVEVIPPSIGPETDKFVEKDPSGDGGAGDMDNGNTSGDNASGGDSTPPDGGGVTTNPDGGTDTEDSQEALEAAAAALNAQLKINGEIEYAKGSDYAKAYEPLLEAIEALKDSDGYLKADVTVKQLEELTQQLKDIVTLSTDAPK